MKYAFKLPAIALILGIVIIGIFLASYIVTSQMKSDALIINLAGRQRALSQKMGKELFSCAQKIALKQDAAETKKMLGQTMSVFRETLLAFKNGGKAPLDISLATSKYQKCPKPFPELLPLIRRAEEVWNPIEMDIQTVLSGNCSDVALLATVEPRIGDLFESSEKIVAMLQAESEKRLSLLFRIQLVGAVIGFAAIVWIILLVKVLIFKLQQADTVTTQYSKGNLTSRVAIRRAVDELDTTLDCINRLGENIAGIVGQIYTANSTLVGVAGDFSTTFGTISENAQNVRARMHSVASSSEEVSANVHSISAGTEEMSASMRTVAISMEEMSASITEVAKNCQQESMITQRAQKQVTETGLIMNNLGASANEIGRIIETINDIAKKTNLLALNATIEAASAGEAGKGFAVVANEVKELARQTSQSTTYIRTQIEKMQNDTNESVSSMNKIAEVIDEVNSISHTIAAAVEEQSVTSNEIAKNLVEASTVATEIARNVGEIAIGIDDVSKNIVLVNNDTGSVTDSIIAASPQVQQLVELGTGLNSVVSTFKIDAPGIVWSDEFSVRIPVIDDQHVKLIDMINDLNDALRSGKARSAVQNILDRLVDYVDVHFKAEEKLFVGGGYPESDTHKKMHVAFVNKALAFRDDYNANRAMVGTDIVVFLKEWLINHIMYTDKKYVPWVKKYLKGQAL